MAMNGVCAHTSKPHKWKRVDKITTHKNGRVVDWMQCKGCGRIWGKDIPHIPAET